MAGTKSKSAPIAWRLEAFDLRAGLAFATCREEQAPEQVARDWPCLFFAPPDFTAEAVDNIAAALSATRGCFDSELLVNDREASFETPEEVADFVRRAYVSSASGDGSDGPGGTEPLPPPPEGPGELPRLDDGHSAVAEALLASIDSFSKQTQKVKDGKSFGWTWAVAPQTTTFESLASGALHLMLEMLDRLPQNGDVRAECQWLDDARTLGGAIADLGLWDAVLFNHGSLLRSKRYPPHWVGKYHLPESELAFALFACPAMPDDEQRFRHWWRAMHEFGWLLHEQQAAVDPGECVSRWPVPRFALGMMPSDMRDKASVEHLLAAFAGCPWSVRQLGSSARGVVDVVLFTCAYLVNWRQPATRNLGAYWLRPRHPSSMAIAAIERRGQAGMKWILEQLPSRGFSFGYEAVIERTRGIRYRDGSGGVLLSSKSAV